MPVTADRAPGLATTTVFVTVQVNVAAPWLPEASVAVTVLSHGRGDKVRIFKMRRRKHYQKRQGHRQQFTELQIGAIVA